MLNRQPDDHDPQGPAAQQAGLSPPERPGPGGPPPELDDTVVSWPGAAADLGRVRAVIDALPEAVFVMESDGELRLTNPAADLLFASQPIHDRADLLSRLEEIAPDRRRRPSGQPSRGPQPPVTVRPRDRPNRWFAMRTVDLEPVGDEPSGPRPDPDASAADAAPGQTAFVLRDVTDSPDLRPVREAFLAVLSHELRTPITTIYAGSSVLARHPTLSAAATRTLARDISAEAARLYDLVEDLLVLARLERSVLEPHDEPVLVQRSVDATIRMIGDRLVDSPIERRGEVDIPPVRGDATYVEQACRDLIVAAVRYAGPDPDRRLVIDVRSDPVAREVSVAVLDRGPGLAPDELDRAFELPDASATGRLAGSGVGPFVSRHLVEAMGGRVWARNRADGGGLEMGFALRIDER